MRLIVTRPAAQAMPWVVALQALGLDAQALPLIDIAPPRDLAPVRAAWRALDAMALDSLRQDSQALVMFVSANAVEHFFAARPTGLEWPATLLAGSTGPGTTAALRAAGVPHIEEPAADAPQFDTEALWARLALRRWQGARVWVVRGEDGRDWLADTLRAQGAEVAFVAAYRRVPPVLDAAGRALLAAARAKPEQHLWLFSSSQALGHLQALSGAGDWSAALAFASHPRIAQAARQAGFGQVALVAPTPQAVALQLGRAGPGAIEP